MKRTRSRHTCLPAGTEYSEDTISQESAEGPVKCAGEATIACPPQAGTGRGFPEMNYLSLLCPSTPPAGHIAGHAISGG